ncbi:MAG: hypothetical protein ACO23O_01590 [Ilumatobacteraceae bacterium]
MAGDQVVVRFIGGAEVGFDLPESDVEQIRSRLAYAVVGTTASHSAERTPRVRYCTRIEGPSVTRHDQLRESSETVIEGGVDGIVDDLHLTIALHATDSIFIHAGAVAIGGTAILLPGRSHVGKSTLVAALVRAGADYLSDEYARIAPDGSVLPYARPIHLRTPAGRRTIDPETIGRVIDTAVPPGLIVVTRYDADAAFEPRPVRPARAALELFDNVVAARTSPAAAMAAVGGLARSTPTFRTKRPDVATAAPALLDFVGSIGSISGAIAGPA